ncbi:MAG: S8 family serine peptidase [Planctomycetota bacterium]
MRFPWSLNRCGVPALRGAGLTGKGVRVGLLETGIRPEHPALAGRLASYAELDRRGVHVPKPTPDDVAGHGTHVAGTICGGAAPGFSSVGVAPAAELCVARCTDGGDAIARILGGLDWLLDQEVRVACLALGVTGRTPVFDTLLAALTGRGVLTVLSSGNRGAGHALSPAHRPEVLTVGSFGRTGRVSRFSGSLNAPRGKRCLKPELLAPGEEILSAAPDGGFAKRSGTSMACAFVAGVAALLFEARPDAAAGEVFDSLARTARPPRREEAYRSVGGPLDAAAALARLDG